MLQNVKYPEDEGPQKIQKREPDATNHTLREPSELETLMSAVNTVLSIDQISLNKGQPFYISIDLLSYLSDCINMYQPISLSIHLLSTYSAYLFIYLSIYLSIHLSIYRSIYLSIYIIFYLFICLPVSYQPNHVIIYLPSRLCI